VKRKSISVAPLLVGAVSVTLSVLLCVKVLSGFGTDAVLPWAITGYVLTPFVAAGALIWAQGLDLSLQGDHAYHRLDGRKRVNMVGLIAIVSFAPAFVHILYISSFVGSLIS